LPAQASISDILYIYLKYSTDYVHLHELIHKHLLDVYYYKLVIFLC